MKNLASWASQPIYKIRFLFFLLLACTLLAGCFKQAPDQNALSDAEVYTGKYTALYPFGVKIQQEPDYSRMTVNKLYSDPSITRDTSTHCGKDFYFLNALYWESKKMGTGYEHTPLSFQHNPTKEPLYFDWKTYLRVWDSTEDLSLSLETLEGNVLLTWYLKTHLEPACIYCDEEEQKEAGTVEVWGLFPEDTKDSRGLILWYTDGNHIVALYPNLRYDAIDEFNSYEKCTESSFGIPLRSLANDGKIHTFRVVLDDWGAQEWAYFGSIIRERDYIK